MLQADPMRGYTPEGLSLVSALYYKLLDVAFQGCDYKTLSLFRTNGTNPINFIENDFELEEVLQGGLSAVSNVRNIDDLRKINEFVYKSRRYEKSKELLEQRYRKPLGYVWKNYGATCIEFSGVLFSLLTILNVKSDVVYVPEKHTFLEVSLDAVYIADPNKNFVIPKENYLEEIREMKKKTSSYEGYQKLRLAQNNVDLSIMSEELN